MSLRKKFLSHPDYFRGTIFGIEDALVSTTGVVVGVSAGTNNKDIVILAGLVTVAVEALSMGAGQYLSEESVHQLSAKKHTDSLFVGAMLMFVGYVLAGMIPIAPLILFPFEYSSVGSVLFAFIGLFTLGYIKGKLVRVGATQSALKILVVGGMAVLIGIVVGRFLKVT